MTEETASKEIERLEKLVRNMRGLKAIIKRSRENPQRFSMDAIRNVAKGACKVVLDYDSGEAAEDMNLEEKSSFVQTALKIQRYFESIEPTFKDELKDMEYIMEEWLNVRNRVVHEDEEGEKKK